MEKMNAAQLDQYNRWRCLEEKTRSGTSITPKNSVYKVSDMTLQEIKELESLRITVRHNLFNFLTPEEKFDLVKQVSNY